MPCWSPDCSLDAGWDTDLEPASPNGTSLVRAKWASEQYLPNAVYITFCMIDRCVWSLLWNFSFFSFSVLGFTLESFGCSGTPGSWISRTFWRNKLISTFNGAAHLYFSLSMQWLHLLPNRPLVKLLIGNWTQKSTHLSCSKEMKSKTTHSKPVVSLIVKVRPGSEEKHVDKIHTVIFSVWSHTASLTWFSKAKQSWGEFQGDGG